MLALTELFSQFRRPTDMEINAAVETLTEWAQKGSAKHPLFRQLPLEQFWQYRRANDLHGSIVGCVLEYLCSLGGSPQGLLYFCERTNSGQEENRLTCRDVVHNYILQGRNVPAGWFNMNWMFRPLFTNSTRCIFQLDIAFEQELVAIGLSGEADLVNINTAELAVAGFTTTTEATGENVLKNLCRWRVIIPAAGQRISATLDGELDSFSWDSYVNLVFGKAVSASLLRDTVKQEGGGQRANDMVKVVQEYFHQEEIRELINQLESTIRELSSPRYQSLKELLWQRVGS